MTFKKGVSASLALLLALAADIATAAPKNCGDVLRERFARLARPAKPPISGRFLAPNETNPEHALPIYEKMKPGMLVTVGTERGFLHAGMSPSVTHLALVDVDEMVVRFNEINTALLRASRNLDDYRWLRLEASRADWAARKIPIDAKAWEWWEEKVRLSRGTSANEVFLIHGSGAEFSSEANYLRSPEQFARVKKLADEDRIYSIHADLADSKSGGAIAKALGKQNLRVTAIDVSNAWEGQYAGPKGIDRFLESMDSVMDREALLILTDLYRHASGNWKYYGIGKSHLSSWSCQECFWKWFWEARKDFGPAVETALLRLEPPSSGLRDVTEWLVRGESRNPPDSGTFLQLLRSGRSGERSLALQGIEKAKVLDKDTLAETLKLLAAETESVRLEAELSLAGAGLRLMDHEKAFLGAADRALGAGSDSTANFVNVANRVLWQLPEKEAAGIRSYLYRVLEEGRPDSGYAADAFISLANHDSDKAGAKKKLTAFLRRFEKAGVRSPIWINNLRDLIYR